MSERHMLRRVARSRALDEKRTDRPQPTGHLVHKLVSVLAVGAAIGGSAAIPSSAIAKSCPTWDVHAVISGQQKRLGAGEFCAVRDNPQYHRYGFECVRYPSGYYHLKRRS